MVKLELRAIYLTSFLFSSYPQSLDVGWISSRLYPRASVLKIESNKVSEIMARVLGKSRVLGCLFFTLLPRMPGHLKKHPTFIQTHLGVEISNRSGILNLAGRELLVQGVHSYPLHG